MRMDPQNLAASVYCMVELALNVKPTLLLHTRFCALMQHVSVLKTV